MKIYALPFLFAVSLSAQTPSATTDAKIATLQAKISKTGATSTATQQHEMLRQLFDLKAESAREHMKEKNDAEDAKLKAASQEAAAKAAPKN